MKKELTEEQYNQVLEAIKAAYSLSIANSEENESTCHSYRIEPFNTNWDKKTVDEVAKSVSLYVSSWILHPIVDAIGADCDIIKKELECRHLKTQVERLKKRIKELEDQS